MIVPSIILFVLLAVFVYFKFLRNYITIRETPAYLVAASFTAFFIPSSIVALVPIDVTPSIFSLPDGALLAIWRIVYWLSFSLTWAILPIMQSYLESGHQDPKKRWLQALRENGRYQLVILGVGALAMVYYALTVRLSFDHIKSLIIALAHSYALLLAIFLLGHGLVNVPRRLLMGASHRHTLIHLEKSAPKIHDGLADANTRLTDLARQVKALQQIKNPQFQFWLDSLAETLPDVQARAANAEDLTEDNLAALTRRIKYVKRKRDRFQAQWDRLLDSANYCKEILSSRGSFPLLMLPPKIAYFYVRYGHPILYYTLSFICSVASFCVFLSELTHTKFSILQITVDAASGSPRQLLASLWLAYMCVCAYSALLRIKIFNLGLVHRKTDGGSMVIFGSYLCRLTVPLSYNFLTLLRRQESVFEEFLGRSINLTPLGAGWNEWLPVLIVVPVLATSLNFYDRVNRWAGYGIWDDEDEEEGSWVEGRELIRKASQERGQPVYTHMDDEDEDEDNTVWEAIRDRLHIGSIKKPKWMTNSGWIGLHEESDEV